MNETREESPDFSRGECQDNCFFVGIDKSYRSQNHTNLKTPKHKGER